MEKVHIGNRDVLGAQEFRLKCSQNNIEGIMIDDDGIEYKINRYGVPFVGDRQRTHPAEELSSSLSAEIITNALAKRKAVRATTVFEDVAEDVRGEMVIAREAVRISRDRNASVQTPVQVKALEWRRGYCDDQVTIHQATTIGGVYQVRVLNSEVWLDKPGSKAVFSSSEEAMAAAQADFDNLILSAISGATPDAIKLWNETANDDAFCAKLGVTPMRDTATGIAVMWREGDGDYHNFAHVIEASLPLPQQPAQVKTKTYSKDDLRTLGRAWRTPSVRAEFEAATRFQSLASGNGLDVEAQRQSGYVEQYTEEFYAWVLAKEAEK